MNKPLLKQALDAIEELRYSNTTHAADTVCDAAIAALESELAKPDPEPIAYIFQKFCSDSFGDGWEERIERTIPSYYTTKNIQPLYAAAPEPEGCLSNCDTCTYAWGSPANHGHCFMFFEEPQGVCPKHSEPGQTRNCSRHPDAPHGFDRNGSHAAGRHVCECENWAPGEAS